MENIPLINEACLSKCIIGLMGLVVNNGNMGCVALTYSTIYILESLSQQINMEFSYYIFEYKADQDKIEHMCDVLGLSKTKIFSCEYSNKFAKRISECTLIFDMTEGDSFSDIYGSKRFLKDAFRKLKALSVNSNFVLGPQTIGPYVRTYNKILAKYILKKANSVSTRDSLSREYVEKLCGFPVQLFTDLAFSLPYDHSLERKEMRVGICISKLLYNEEYDHRRIKLRADYQEYTKNLIQFLLEHHYNVYLLAHVNGDYEVCKNLYELFPDTTLVHRFRDPVEAKNYISTMSLLVSPRMHASIAAYSAGVATIPIGYSRKFAPMYADIGLNRVIDLENMDTETALEISRSIMNSPELNVIDEKGKILIENKLAAFKSEMCAQLIKQVR